MALMTTRECRNEKDELHCIDGPALEWDNGDKAWFLNGKRHRTDGPAIEDTDGYKAWYLNGQRHRIDGPAIIRADGYKAWYLNGKKITKEQIHDPLFRSLYFFTKKEKKDNVFKD